MQTKDSMNSTELTYVNKSDESQKINKFSDPTTPQ